MTQEEFKSVVAYNLVWFRKRKGLTQLQLAEKFNYSDKAISKWERGESLPDAYTLQTLAEFYEITLDDFLVKQRKKPLLENKRAKFIISLMSALLVWIVATATFVLLTMSIDWKYSWTVFIFAIPPCFIVLEIFSKLWGKFIYQLISVSGILWGTSLSIFMILKILNYLPNYSWLIFIIAIPIQVLFFLWYYLKHIRKPKVD